jgi:hypothetical protein
MDWLTMMHTDPTIGTARPVEATSAKEVEVVATRTIDRATTTIAMIVAATTRLVAATPTTSSKIAAEIIYVFVLSCCG